MALLQANRLPQDTFMSSLPEPANSDELQDLQAAAEQVRRKKAAPSSDQKIVAWLFKVGSPRDIQVSFDFEDAAPRKKPSLLERNRRFLMDHANEPLDDWQTVASISGHSVQELLSSGMDLPLSAAEIDHFRRNHRETDRLVERDFLTARNDLPSPVGDLYGLYCHRARLDAEATLFVAQGAGSVRIARIMADLLAIGAFANADEHVSHLTMTYAVPAAFDTSDLIDRACDEALRRLSLPIESPAHLLKMTPDEINVLANNIVERHMLSPDEFLKKANLLSEARQDVSRMPSPQRLTIALHEKDLPKNKAWVFRLCEAYARIFESWLPDMPEVQAMLQEASPACALQNAE